MKHLATILHTALILLTSSAAVPLRWTVETSRATPAAFEAYQGETLEFEAALTSHGKPLQAPLNYAIYWQTNGMGSVYWSTNCATAAGATNVMRATWRPEYDAGAKTYNCFIGAPGDIYHAAFQLRLRPSPGASPGALPLPTPTIDFARVTVLNPPWPTNDLTSAVASNAAAIATNAAAIASHSSHLSQLSQTVDDHIGDTTNNPHGVTAEQVGAYSKQMLVYIGRNYIDVAEDADAQTLSELSGRGLRIQDNALSTYYDVDGIRFWHDSFSLKFPSKSGIFALTSDIPPPPGDYAAVSNAAMTAHRDATNYTDAAVAALDAALREYPRIVRRGGMYYTEDIVDRGGDDITYSLSRFPVVSFSAVGAASSLTVTKTASASVSLEVGDGRAEFSPLAFGATYQLPVGATLYVRATGGVTNATLYGCNIATEGRVAVGGDIMALVSQDAPLKISGASCFKELFKGSLGIVDASSLSLPATNLANYCYQKMFDGCMEMVRGPKLLPALQPSVGCYYTMFSDCRKMTEGPVIMLDNVNKSTACSWMFVDCWLMTSLSMPNCRGSATQNNGMRGMIQNTGNVRLISVPKLETFYACDQWIFMGEDKPYYPWPTDGTFVCPAALGDNETIARGVSACPPGWTVINK